MFEDMAARLLLGFTSIFSKVFFCLYVFHYKVWFILRIFVFVVCSNEYPLFIPRQNYCTATGDNSWAEKSSSNFGVASMESDRKPCLDSTRNTSFNYSAASPHSIETHKDLQRGISLLKKSVACITAYCYNSLCLDIPPEASTFEGFAKLLAMLSSSNDVRSAFMSSSRYISFCPLFMWLVTYCLTQNEYARFLYNCFSQLHFQSYQLTTQYYHLKLCPNFRLDVPIPLL